VKSLFLLILVEIKSNIAECSWEILLHTRLAKVDWQITTEANTRPSNGWTLSRWETFALTNYRQSKTKEAPQVSTMDWQRKGPKDGEYGWLEKWRKILQCFFHCDTTPSLCLLTVNSKVACCQTLQILFKQKKLILGFTIKYFHIFLNLILFSFSKYCKITEMPFMTNSFQ